MNIYEENQRLLAVIRGETIKLAHICPHCGTTLEVEEETYSKDRLFKHSCRGDK